LRGRSIKFCWGGNLPGEGARPRWKINDVIDFWRVEDLQRNKRLLLRARDENAGKHGWNFKSRMKAAKRLSINAYFYTQSLGEVVLVFLFTAASIYLQSLIKQIEKEAFLFLNPDPFIPRNRPSLPCARRMPSGTNLNLPREPISGIGFPAMI
jgi:hypothetical protein